MTSRYIRLGGLAAIAGAALLALADLWGLVMELFGLGPEKFSEVAATGAWTVVSTTFLAAAVLILLGLVALYARQAEPAGVLGLIGFLAAFVGTALLVGATWAFAFIAPSAAVEAPAFLDAEQVAGPLNVGFILTFSAFAVGWVLFGVATIRARVFPRAAAIALTLGALVSFAPLPGVTVVLSAAVIWMGFVLYSERREAASSKVSPPQPAV